jgi:hypothetical protein
LGLSQVLLESANDPNKPAIVIPRDGRSTSGDYMFRFHLGAFLSDLPVQLVTVRYKIWSTTRSLHHISSGWLGMFSDILFRSRCVFFHRLGEKSFSDLARFLNPNVENSQQPCKHHISVLRMPIDFVPSPTNAVDNEVLWII